MTLESIMSETAELYQDKDDLKRNVVEGVDSENKEGLTLLNVRLKEIEYQFRTVQQ